MGVTFNQYASNGGLEIYDSNDVSRKMLTVSPQGNVTNFYRANMNKSVIMPKTLAVTATNISGSLDFDCYEVSAATTISLFLPTAQDGAVQKIYNRGTTGVVTIDPMGAATINGASTVKLSGAASFLELRGKSTNWRIVGRSTKLLMV